MNSKEAELQDLIGRLSEGVLTDEDARRLGELLQGDPIAQESYLDHVLIHGLLEREFSATAPVSPQSANAGASKESREDVMLPPAAVHTARFVRPLSSAGEALSERARPRSSHRALAAAALLVTGVALGWFLPLSFPRSREAAPHPLALFDPGFEAHVAADANGAALTKWYGDLAESVGPWGNVTPIEGQRMLRFVKSSVEPGNAFEIYQLVDLRRMGHVVGRNMSVEASASFNSHHEGVDETDFVFGVTVFAFSDAPTVESELWPMRWQQPLTFSGRQLPSNEDPQSWQSVTTQLSLPDETRFLVVQLSITSTESDTSDQFPGVFADNVKLQLVSSR
jgi:hypothetical protein